MRYCSPDHHKMRYVIASLIIALALTAEYLTAGTFIMVATAPEFTKIFLR